jgi:beta-glucanase (GH16 family)
MKKLLTAIALLTTLTASSYSACWNMVWHDEFDGPNINTAYWNFETGCGGWGNNELENYLSNDASTAYIENGNLVIQANNLNTGGGACGYTSARMTTQDKVHFTYGRIEARIKTVYGKGMWPAFWMLGQNIGSVGWPACGEIDIMEMVGGGSGFDNVCYGTAHWDNNGHASYGLSTSIGWPAKLSDDYHIYAVEWDASQIRWYFDSNNYCTLNTNGASMEEFTGRDFFILLNVAVGGSWPGSPDGSTVFPQKMYVDYVRWYQDGACGPTNTPSPTPTLVTTNIPGNVQFEDYMNGGEGVSYHDTTAGNTPGQYRNDDVDIEACSDAGGGYDVGYTAAGEWLNYSVNVLQAGIYSIGAHVASLGAGGTFHLELDGANISGALTVPDTGGWQTWQVLTVNNINIGSIGLKTLKLVMDANGATGGIGNFNYVSFSAAAYTSTPTPAMTMTPVITPAPTNTPPAGIDALIPLVSGRTMTCQFINNTGNYSDSQVYVIAIGLNAAMKYCHLDTAGNMIPCVSGDNAAPYFVPLSSINGLQFPDTMISVRLYISLGAPLNIPFNTDAAGNVGIAYPNIDNPSDPSYTSVFDWEEFNLQNNTIFLNSSQVDMFGIPTQLRLYDNGAPNYTLNGQMGIPYSMAQIVSDWAAQEPAEFQNLNANNRISAPIHGLFAAGKTYANYFDSYINSMWAQYAASDLVLTIAGSVYTGRVGGDGRLAFTTPGDPVTYYVSKPTTQDVFMGAGALATGNGVEKQLEAQICAAFNRHVLQNISLANTPSAFYQAVPANYYAWFWHAHSLNNLAYGFCYDDVSNQSTTLVSTNPRGMVVVIGANNQGTPTSIPTRTMTSVNITTSTFTITPTATKTNTLTFTATQTPTGSATRTATSTAVSTAVNTGTSTAARTATSTATSTAVNTGTSTATRTATSTVTLTAANTGTSTATRTATAPVAASTATATGTGTATVINTSTQTAVNTPAHTPAITNTAQNTATQSATAANPFTPLSTCTPRASAIASVSPSPSYTETQSATASVSPSPSYTETQSATASVSPSPSYTETQSATASVSPSPSYTETQSATASVSPSPSYTETQSATASVSPSPSYTETQSATASVSPSPSYTETQSATASVSPSPSYTETQSATASVSASPSYTETQSATASVSSSPSYTETQSATASVSPSPSYTETQTASMSATRTWTNTAVNTFTATPSNTVSSTATGTFTPAATRTFTATGIVTTIPVNTPVPTATKIQNEKLEIQNTVAYPNPYKETESTGIYISFNLAGSAVNIKFRLYTAGYRFIREASFTAGQVKGNLTTGTNVISIAPDYFKGLAAGAYYYVLSAWDGSGNRASSGLKTIIILR